MRCELVIYSVVDVGEMRFEDRRGPVVKRPNFTSRKLVQQQYPRYGGNPRESRWRYPLNLPMDDNVKHLKGNDYAKWSWKLNNDLKAWRSGRFCAFHGGMGMKLKSTSL